MCVAAALVVHAHTVGRIESAVSVDGARVRMRLLLDLLEIADLDVNHDGAASLAELDQSIERVYELVKQHVRIDSDSAPARTTLERYAVQDGHVGELDVVFDFASRPNRLTINSTLDRALPASPEHVLSVSFGNAASESVLLDASHPEATFTRRPQGWLGLSRRTIIGLATTLIVVAMAAAAVLQIRVWRA
jgi:hypothetical protein